MADNYPRDNNASECKLLTGSICTPIPIKKREGSGGGGADNRRTDRQIKTYICLSLLRL